MRGPVRFHGAEYRAVLRRVTALLTAEKTWPAPECLVEGVLEALDVTKSKVAAAYGVSPAEPAQCPRASRMSTSRST